MGVYLLSGRGIFFEVIGQVFKKIPGFTTKAIRHEFSTAWGNEFTFGGQYN
jgi:hypothetical protein